MITCGECKKEFDPRGYQVHVRHCGRQKGGLKWSLTRLWMPSSVWDFILKFFFVWPIVMIAYDKSLETLKDSTLGNGLTKAFEMQSFVKDIYTGTIDRTPPCEALPDDKVPNWQVRLDEGMKGLGFNPVFRKCKSERVSK